MYNEMLYDQYKMYSYEKLKEITVANGYTEEAEKIAAQIRNEKAKYSRNTTTQAETPVEKDVSQDSDSDMTTEQLKEMLYDEYKTYSYEELQEITFANGYTKEAEQVARQLLGKDTTEYWGNASMNMQEAMWEIRRKALPVQSSTMKVHCKAIAWIGSIFGILFACCLLIQILPLASNTGSLGFALLLLALATGAFIIYVIWVLWHTFAEILDKMDIMDSRLMQMDMKIDEKKRQD